MYKTIKGKLLIKADLELLTGLHIGSSDNFSHIGAVNSIVIRDPLTKEPIIPGSSVKGKLRFLLAKSLSDNKEVIEIKDEPKSMMRLFGGTKTHKNQETGKDKDEIIYGRLQFWDLFMTNADYIKKMGTDLHLTEIKFENTIGRSDAKANPRQIERVPKGAKFRFKMTYNIEDEGDLINDFKNIFKAMILLHMDYLGGSGTRGYGRVSIENFEIDELFFDDDVKEILQDDITLIKEGFNEMLQNKIKEEFKNATEYSLPG